MTQTSEPTGADLILDPRSPKALTPDDRRHLTRFLGRHCAAVPLLDACTEGHGPLPELMDRLVAQVVDTHRHLSGGTFVDAGERLEVHAQSLRVLARKVNTRDVPTGTIFEHPPEAFDKERWWAVVAAFLWANGSIRADQLPASLSLWTGPVDEDEVAEELRRWKAQGWVRDHGGVLVPGVPDPLAKVPGHIAASVIADHIVDHAGILLATPAVDAAQPRFARLSFSRGLLYKKDLPGTADEAVRHLQATLARTRQKFGTGSGDGETVCVALMMGPSSQGLRGYGPRERDLWLNALCRHVARHGGIREAMPILYQEVARELRRRSVKRAYDPELLKAVGRARQNVHEWEAGKGFHFRGPAPVTVIEDAPETLTPGHVRQYARVFLQERSQRACKLEEFITWLQAEVGVKIEEHVLMRLLDEEVAMGAARVVSIGSDVGYQAVQSFRRTWAQNTAQRRANLEMVIRSCAGLVAGSSALPEIHRTALGMIFVEAGSEAAVATEVRQRTSDFHAQLLGRHENLDPEDEDVLDVEVSIVLSPTAAPLGPPSRKK